MTMAILGILWAIGAAGLMGSPDRSRAADFFAVLLLTATALLPVAMLFEAGIS